MFFHLSLMNLMTKTLLKTQKNRNTSLKQDTGALQVLLSQALEDWTMTAQRAMMNLETKRFPKRKKRKKKKKRWMATRTLISNLKLDAGC